MKEYLIDDIEVLEQDVFDSLSDYFAECKRTIRSLGYNLEITMTAIENSDKSKINFHVYGINCSMKFAFAFIARGKNGGFYVASCIKNGDCESKIRTWIERVKTLIVTKGFDEAKSTFDGEVRDCYKETDYFKWITTGLIVFGIIGIVGIITMTLISVLAS